MKTIHRNNIALFVVLPLLAIVFLGSCRKNYHQLPVYSENGNLQAVIEIPAGCSKKYEYQAATNSFVMDKKDGKQRIVQYLPYPANYGFIPSTMMDNQKGGDGDALDVLVIAQSLETGTIIEIEPLAMLSLRDDNEIDNKIIAIPKCREMQIISSNSLQLMEKKYPGVKEIIELWFCNYKGNGQTKALGWYDEKRAIAEIEKWTISTEK